MTSLCFDLGDETGTVILVVRAGEHEVLPHQDAEAVARVVEGIGLVDPTAPHAHHVHVGVTCGLENLAIGRFCNPARETVKGNYVRPFSKNGNAIDDELHAAAPVVRIAPQHE